MEVVIGTLAALVVLLGMALRWLSRRPAAPANYQQTVPTGGPIEARYLANGPHEVLTHEDATLLDFGKFIVHYPADLPERSDKCPVVVLCNGTGIPLSKYPAVARHYASWGFVVIGTEEKNSWNAFGAEMCLRHLERVAERETIDGARNPLYQRVDLANVGVVGHSQGGVGAINAVTTTLHRGSYKTAVALSPTNKALADELLWDYEASAVRVPALLLSGAGGGDDWVVTGEQLRAIYDDVPSEKVVARRADTSHGEMLYAADGYVTAWLMWQLRGDAEAAAAFAGDDAELFSNARYQDQQRSLG